tara:strand:- start:185201 stop:185656 length:456 start_codon:yes stop_codon:yes gene_type:complete
MKTIKRTVLLTLIASVSLLFSCAKDGEDGLPGPAGPAGNANVKSQTFDVYWSSSSFVDLYATIVTQSIVNSGSVMTYIQESPGTWIALPINTNYNIVYSYSVNNVRVYVSPQPSGYDKFKVVAIASSARLANPNVDYTNYEEVKATFNLKD